MKKAVFAGLALCLSAVPVAYAQGPQLMDISLQSLNFAAPVLPSTSAGADKEVGSIIYDSSDNTFKGLDSGGTWNAMTIPGGTPNVSSSATGQQKLQIAKITNNGSTCASPPSVGWVSASRSNTGICDLFFSGFSSQPTCVVTTARSDAALYVCGMTNGGTSGSGQVKCLTPNTLTPTDTDFNIVCMGPQ